MPKNVLEKLKVAKAGLVCLTVHGVVLFLMSCTGHHETDHSTVFVGLSAPPITIDPRFATDATGSRIAGLLFSAFVRIGQDLKPTGEAAESWTNVGLRYTFKLRPGLVFSNKRPLNKDDILFSFEQAQSAQSPFHSSFSSIQSIDAHYDEKSRDVVIQLAHPSPTFLSDLPSVKLLPKAELLANREGFSQNPIGTGPFQLVSINTTEITLRARPNHAYASPKIETVVFKVIRDDNTRAIKMLRGEIDLAQAEFPPLKVRALEKSADLKVLSYPGLSMTYLLVNHQDHFLAQKEVRQAISKAIDRESLTKYKLEGLATPATSLLTSRNLFFNSKLKPESYSVEEAKRLLPATGLVNLELKTSNAPTAMDNGRIIAHELNEIGLQTKTRSFEWATFYSDVQAGRFQLALMRWVGTIDPDLYRKALHSGEEPPVGRNRGHYKNQKLDRLLEQGFKTNDTKTRTDIYSEVQQIVFDDLAIIPLWYDTEVAVINRRLTGYEPPADGSFWPLTQLDKK